MPLPWAVFWRAPVLRSAVRQPAGLQPAEPQRPGAAAAPSPPARWQLGAVGQWVQRVVWRAAAPGWGAPQAWRHRWLPLAWRVAAAMEWEWGQPAGREHLAWRSWRSAAALRRPNWRWRHDKTRQRARSGQNGVCACKAFREEGASRPWRGRRCAVRCACEPFRSHPGAVWQVRGQHRLQVAQPPGPARQLQQRVQAPGHGPG